MSTSNVGSDDRTWAIYANAAGLLVFTNIPFANLLATFLIWLKVKNDAGMPFARAHAAAAFNFQLTWTLTVFILAIALLVTLVRPSSMGYAVAMMPMLFLVYLLLVVVNLVASIIGCMRASDMKPFSYPFAIPFVK